jgi:di/tricarboxylate transporter
MKVVSTFALVLVLAQALTSNAAVNFYPTTPRSAPNPIQYGSANYRRAKLPRSHLRIRT